MEGQREQACHERARALMAIRRYQAALEQLGICLRDDPEDAHAVYLMAYCHLHLGDHYASEDAARKACALAPDNGAYHVALAEALRLGGSPNSGKAEARTAVELSPHSASAFYALACCEHELGLEDDALATLHKALALDPDHHLSLALKSTLLTRRNDTLGADRAVRAALSMEPLRASYLARKAWNDFVAGTRVDHVAAFRAALAQDPFDGLARFGMLRALAPFPRWLAWSIRHARTRAERRLTGSMPVVVGQAAWAVVLYAARVPPYFVLLPALAWRCGSWFVADDGPDVLLSIGMLRKAGRALSTPTERWKLIRRSWPRSFAVLFALGCCLFDLYIGLLCAVIVTVMLLLHRVTDTAHQPHFLGRLAVTGGLLYLTSRFIDHPAHWSAAALGAALFAAPGGLYRDEAR